MLVAIVAVVIAAAGGAYAATSSSSGTISVCVHKRGHGLYLAARCKHGDRRLSWNAAGPAGRNGAAGQSGTSGQAGPPGATGATGPLGAAGGDLTGTYPNPSIAAGAVSNGKLANSSLTVTAGNGLTGGGQVALGGSDTLSVDPAAVQMRVGTTCPGGAISAIAQDGGVTCQPTMIAYASGTGASSVFSSSIPTGPPTTVAFLPLDGDALAAIPSTVAQPFPTDETIRTITVTFTASIPQTPSAAVGVQAFLYVAPAGSSNFVAVPGPAATVPSEALAANQSFTSTTPANFSFPVTAGEQGAIGIAVNQTISPTTVTGFLAVSLGAS